MGIPVIEQAKIQAQILVPLVKALQAELGEERANSLVRRALGDIYRRYGEEFWRRKNEKNLGKVVESITNEMNPKQAEALRTIAQNADPTLVCAYGNPDNIVLASKGKLFGLDFNTMAIAKILDAGRGTEERK